MHYLAFVLLVLSCPIFSLAQNKEALPPAEKLTIYTNVPRMAFREFGLGLRHALDPNLMLELDGAWKMRNPNAVYSSGEWDFFSSHYPGSDGYRLRAGIRYADQEAFRHGYMAAHLGYLHLTGKNVADYLGLEFEDACQRYWTQQNLMTWSVTAGLRFVAWDRLGFDFFTGVGLSTGRVTRHYQEMGRIGSHWSCDPDPTVPEFDVPRIEQDWVTRPVMHLGMRLDFVLWK